MRSRLNQSMVYSVIGVFDDVAVLVWCTHVICIYDEQKCRQYAALGSSGVDGDLFRVSFGCFHVLHYVSEEHKSSNIINRCCDTI